MGKKIKYNGFELAKPIYDVCEASIKSYPALTHARESLREVDGLHKHFAEEVIYKLDLDRKIAEIEEAFEQVPETYRDAVKYYFFSNQKKSEIESVIEFRFELDYGDTVAWANKMLYLFADNSGYPVSKKGEECNLYIHDDGEVEIY